MKYLFIIAVVLLVGCNGNGGGDVVKKQTLDTASRITYVDFYVDSDKGRILYNKSPLSIKISGDTLDVLKFVLDRLMKEVVVINDIGDTTRYYNGDTVRLKTCKPPTQEASYAGGTLNIPMGAWVASLSSAGGTHHYALIINDSLKLNKNK
jgi:hypothetical protein